MEANPTGPSVVHGQAQFAAGGPGVLNITNSPNAIINWQGFSIAQGEITRFLQQNANSAVLNRVIGQNPSAILGQLLSNGRVFLINPNGIVFGPSAVVDTQGLIASTLNISNENFLAGKYQFEAGAGAGAITNEGFIRAGPGGEVVLIAPSIENSGIIQADDGTLVLAAGRRVTFTSLDAGGVRFEVQAPEDSAVNLGDLIARRGTVGAFAGTLTNTGRIEAGGVATDAAGNIVLTAKSDVTLGESSVVDAGGASGGTVEVSSESGTVRVGGRVETTGNEGTGGSIRVTGDRVAVAGEVDASGASGGGEVLIGGDVQGGGDLSTARQVAVTDDAHVRADATLAGDGGKVVVFATDSAAIGGTLSARGGPGGGDGGFVETSGLNAFAIGATPDVSAPAGRGGTWLIDPHDIEIVAGGGNAGINDFHPFESFADSATLGVDLITGALTGGATVNVTTGGGGTQAGNITLNAALDFNGTGSSTLILSAHNDVVINQSIGDDTPGGDMLNLVLTADSDLNASGQVRIFADVNLEGGDLTTNGQGTVVGNAATVTMSGGIWNNSNLSLSIGDGDSGTVNINAGGQLLMPNGGELVVGGGASGDGTLNVTAGSLVDLGQDFAAGGILRIGAGDGLTSGQVNVTDSDIITRGTSNSIRVGFSSAGGLDVDGSSNLRTLFLELGREADGAGTLTLGSGTLAIVSNDHGRFGGEFADEAGLFRVGFDGMGTATLNAGSQVTVRNTGTEYGSQLQIARNAGSTGTVNVTGGSVLVTENSVPGGNSNIGSGPTVQLRNGTGTLNVTAGGTVTVDSSSAPAFSGSRAQIRVGTSANPSVVNINTGGSVSLLGENAYLPIGDSSTGAVGVINLDGATSSVNLTGFGTGFDNRHAVLAVGDEGSGELNITGGATLNLLGGNDKILVGAAGTGVGTLNVSGASSIINAGTNTGTDGGALNIAPVSGATGTVNLDGAGSLIQAGRWLRLGLSGDTNTGTAGSLGGTATLNVGTVTAGARIEASTFLLGGDMTVTGAGTEAAVVATNSVAATRDRVVVGHINGSVGSLIVSDGADFDVGALFQIARHPGSSGSATVNNATIRVTGVDEDFNNAGPTVSVGRGGSGSLAVENVGTLTLDPSINSSLAVGDPGGLFAGGSSFVGGGNGDGTIVVRDIGSLVDVRGAKTRLRLARETGTSASMTVADGASVQFENPDGTTFGQLSPLGGMSSLIIDGGTLDLDGSGSAALHVGQDAALNPGGPANVVLAGAAILDVGTVNLAGELSGSGTITGTVVTQDGDIAPGGSIGTLSLGGLVLDSGAELLIELAAAPGPGAADFIDVAGSATLAGLLIVRELDPHTNAADDEHVFLTAVGGVSGTFDAVDESFGDVLDILVGANDVTIDVLANDDFVQWVGAGGGSWNDTANWSGGAVPTPGEDVLIGDLQLAGPDQTITIDGAGALDLGAGKLQVFEHLQLDDAGAGVTFTITNESFIQGLLTVDRGTLVVGADGELDTTGVVVGSVSGQTGTLSVDGGDLANTGSFTAGIGGGTGTVNLSGGGSLSTDADLSLGSGGTGNLNVTDGTAHIAQTLHVGFSSSGNVLLHGPGQLEVGTFTILGTAAGGDGSVTVDGASFTAPAQLQVGLNGNGSFSAINGASVSTLAGLLVGAAAGVTGTVTVDGSDWTNSGTTTIGGAGTGTVSLANGASFDSGGPVLVGDQSGSDGTLNVLSGSTFDSDGGANSLLIAAQSGSLGDVNLDGAGSLIRTRGISNSVQVGLVGTGTMDITGGAKVETLLYDVGRFGTGTAILDGVGSQIIAFPEYGTFTGGFEQEAGLLRVSREPGSVANMTVRSGGRVTVRSGVTNNTGNTGAGLQIAREGGTGTLNIEGAGSIVELLETNDPIPGFEAFAQAGRRGDGTLNITGGGELRITNAVNGVLQAGRDAASTGDILVSGSGSKISVSGRDFAANIGQAGTGTLTIENGATAEGISIMNVGRDDGSIGTVDVDNASLRLAGTVVTGSGVDIGPILRIGRDGSANGTVSIFNGGVLEIDGGTLPFAQIDLGGSGFSAGGGSGTLNVGTANGTTDAGGGSVVFTGDSTSIDVGRDGTGTLNMRAGAAITGLASMSIGKTAAGPGEVNLDGAATRITLSGRASAAAAAACGPLGCVVDAGDPADLMVGGAGVGTLNLTNDAGVVINPDNEGLTPVANGIRSKGRLEGTGTINAATVDISGGILSAGMGLNTAIQAFGNPPPDGTTVGTLTISGALILDAGSRFEVETFNASSDRVNVGGTATLAGTLDIFGIDGFSPGVGAESYTVLSYASASGDFGNFLRPFGTDPSFSANTFTYDVVFALGSVITWDGDAGDGNWFSALNWDTDTVPGVDVPGADVLIAAPGLFLNVDGANDIDIGGLSADLGGTGTLFVDISPAQTFSLSGAGSILGDLVVDNGTFSIGPGGDLFVSNSVTVGSNPGSNGTLLVDGGVLEVNGQMTVGLAGTGTASFQNAAAVDIEGASSFGALFIGQQAGSTGTVNVASNSGLDISSNDIAVGVEGDGTLLVNTGAALVAGRLAAATGLDGVGSIDVDGVGTNVSLIRSGLGNRLDIGQQGSATMTIGNGALVDASSGLGDCAGESGCGIFVANGAGSTGTLTVQGGGRLLNRDYFVVGGANVFVFANDGFDLGVAGGSSSGTLNILSGGQVFAGDGFELSAGPGGGSPSGTETSTGTLLIDGAGSRLEVGDNFAAANAPNATADIDVTGGATLAVGDALDLAGGGGSASAVVTMDVNASTLTVDEIFRAGFDFGNGGGRADVNIVNGSTVTIGTPFEQSGFFVFGNNTGSEGRGVIDASTVNVFGIDSGFRVGNSNSSGINHGTGSLTIRNGAIVNTFNMQARGTGDIVIEGAGTTVNLENTPGSHFSGDFVNEAGLLRAGRNTGDVTTLTIRDGAVVNINEGTTQNSGPGLQVARNKGSQGTVVIEGDGTRVNISQSAPVTAFDGGPFLSIGNRGQGSVTIRDGAVVSLEGDESSVAVSLGSASGDPTPGNADGPSLLIVNDAATGGGVGGLAGSLIVNGSGGETFFNVGRDAGSNGIVTVDGVDGLGNPAQILITGLVDEARGQGVIAHIGAAGTGVVNLSNGGELQLVTPAGAALGGMNVGGRGDITGGTGTVNVDGGTLDFMGDTPFAIIGRNGPGALNVTNGGSVTGLTFLTLGRDAGAGDGTVTVDGLGSTIALTGTASADASAISPSIDTGEGAQITVGRNGLGTLVVRNQGALDIDPTSGPTLQTEGSALIVGAFAGSTGSSATIELDGVVTIAGDDARVIVGNDDAGTLTLDTGALLDVPNPDQQSRLIIGRNDGSTGLVEVLGGSSLGGSIPGGAASFGDVLLGEFGTGTLTITGTNSYVTVGGSLTLGYLDDGVTQSPTGAGTLVLDDSGFVSVGQDVLVATSSAVQVLATGGAAALNLGGDLDLSGTLDLDSSLAFGGTPGVTVFLRDGSLIDLGGPGTTFAVNAGTVRWQGGTITGAAGTSLNVAGADFILEGATTKTFGGGVSLSSGTTSDVLLNEGTLASSAFFFTSTGFDMAPGTVVAVTGGIFDVSSNGGVFDVEGMVTVSGAPASMESGVTDVRSGGSVLVQNSADWTSTGAVTVDGGGIVTIDDATWNAPEIVIGETGQGSVGLANGALLTSSGQILIGSQPGSIGTVDLASGSTWDANGAEFVIGSSGQGTMTVSGGAFLDATGQSVFVGRLGSGTLTLSDPGTQYHSALLCIGGNGACTFSSAGDGTVIFSDGITLTVLDVINAGTLQGAGTISGNLRAIDDDLVANTVIIGASAGTLNVGGDFVMNALSALEVELGGVDGGVPEFDILNVGGDATLDGTIDVTLINSFTPAAGNSFEIIAATGSATDDGVIINRPDGVLFAPDAVTQGPPGNVTLLVDAVGIEWIVDANGNWNVPANWSGGALPGSGDLAIIDRPAGQFTVTVDSLVPAIDSLFMGDEVLDVIAGGTLQLINSAATSDASSATINVSGGGVLRSVGDLNASLMTVSDAPSQVYGGGTYTTNTLIWNAGQLGFDSTGDTIFNVTSTALPGTGTRALSGATLNILSDAAMAGGTMAGFGTAVVHVDDGTVLAGPAATFDISGDPNFQSVDFVNDGVLTRSAGGGAARFASLVNNASATFSAGTVEFLASILAPGSATTVDSGAVLAFAAGNHLVQGTLSVDSVTAGVQVSSGADVTVNSTGSITSLGIGNFLEVFGTLHVDGAGGATVDTGTLNVGAAGVLSLTNGAALDTVNMVRVDGQMDLDASTWTAIGPVIMDSGTLTLSNAAVTSSSQVRIGDRSGFMGTVDMQSASTWDANGAEFVIGSSGTGVVTVADGAFLDAETGDVYVGRNGTATGTLTLNGAATQFRADTLCIGGINPACDLTGGTGTVTFTDGITLTVLDVFNAGTLQGAGTITGNLSAADADVDGNTIIVGASAGTLVVSGNYTANTLTELQIELGGTDDLVPQFDILEVGGNATLDGIITVSLIDDFTAPASYLPAAADSFRIVDVDVAGTLTDNGVSIERPAGVIFDPGPVTTGLDGHVTLVVADSGIEWVAGTGDWDIAGNWSANAVPGVGGLVGADVIIDRDLASVVVTLDGLDADIGSLLLAADEALFVTGGATLDIGTASVLDGTLELDAGTTLANAQNVTVDGDLLWRGTVTGGAGAFTTGAASTTTLDGATLSGVDWDNAGFVDWNTATTLTLSDAAAVVTNQAGGTFEQGSFGNATLDGLGSFDNQGQFTKLGAGTLTINVPFVNDATGTLAIGTTSDVVLGSTSANSGLVDVGTGTLVISNSSTTLSLLSGTVLQGNGSVRARSGAMLNIADAGGFSWPGGLDLEILSASIENAQNLTFGGPGAAATLTLAEATIQGAGGTFVTGSDATVLVEDGAGAIGVSLAGLPWDHFGTLTWTGTDDVRLGTAEAVFTNKAGATFTADVSGTTPELTAVGSFVNEGGRFVASPETELGINVTFVNQGGLVELQSAVTEFSETYTQTAGLTSLIGGNATAPGFQFDGGTLEGAGTLTATEPAGAVFDTATITPGPPAPIPGPLVIAGNAAFSANTTLVMELAGAGQFDTLAVTGTLDLNDAALDVQLLGGFTPSGGDSFELVTAGTLNGDFARPVTLDAAINGDVTVANGLDGSAILDVGGLNVFWDALTGGLWSNAANWSTGLVPDDGDAVTIDIAGGAFTVTYDTGTVSLGSLDIPGDDLLAITGGTLGLAGASTLNEVLMTGGTLEVQDSLAANVLDMSGADPVITGGGTIAVTDFAWTAGDLVGFVDVQVANHLQMSGTTSRALQGTVSVLNTATWDGGDVAGVGGAGTIVVESTGTLTIDGDVDLTGGTLVNEGSVAKTGGTGSTLLFDVVNDGTMDLASGEVRTTSLASAGSLAIGTGADLRITNATVDGDVNVAASGQLAAFAGAQQFNAGSSLSGDGLVTFTGGAATIAGSYNVAGTTTVTTNTVAFDTAATTGVLVLATPGGTITGTGSVTADNVIWQAGTIDTVVTAVSTLSIESTGTHVLAAGAGLVNEGAGVWQGGNIDSDASSLFTNRPSGTFEIQTPGLFLAGTLDNQGTLIGNVEGPQVLLPDVVNSGTVQVLQSTLAPASYVQNDPLAITSVENGGGVPAINSAGGLAFNAGRLQGSGSLAGVATFDAATVAPGLSIGTLELQSGVSFSANTILEIELDGTTPGPFTSDQILSSTTIDLGGATLTLLDGGSFSAGPGDSIEIMSCIGTPPCVSGAFGTVNAPPGVFQVDALVNASNVRLANFDAGLLNLWDGDGDGFSWNDPLNWDDALGVPLFNHVADIDLAFAPGPIIINAAVPDVGTITSEVSLQVIAGGDITLLNTATIDADLTLLGGLFTNDGTLTINDGTLALSGGALGGTGAVNVLGTGALHFTDGQMSGSGTVTVGPNAAMLIAGAATKVIDGRTLISDATSGSFNQGTLRLLNSAQFENRGLLEVDTTGAPGPAPAIGDALSSGTFTNSGVLLVDGGGTLTVAGTTLDNTGNLDLAGGSTLMLDGGSHVLQNGGSVDGAGLLDVSGATLTVHGDSYSIGNVQIGSTLTVTDTLEIASSLVLEAGSVVNGGGLLLIDAAADLAMSDTTLDAVVLEHASITGESDIGGTITFAGDALLRNTGVLKSFGVTLGATLADEGSVENAGDFVALFESPVTFNVPLHNTGLVQAFDVPVNIDAGGSSSTGTFDASAPGTFSVNGADFAFDDGHTFSGDGQFNLTGDLQFASGSISNAGAMLAFNVASLTGDAEIDNTGTIDFTDSSLAGPDLKNDQFVRFAGSNTVGAGSDVSGTGDVQVLTDTTSFVAGGDYAITGRTEILPGATAQMDRDASGGIDLRGALLGSGSYRAEGAGNVIDNGTIDLAFTIASNAEVTLQGGGVVDSGNGIILNDGTLFIDGASLDVDTINRSGGLVEVAASPGQSSFESSFDNQAGATLRLRHDASNDAVLAVFALLTQAGTIELTGGPGANRALLNALGHPPGAVVNTGTIVSGGTGSGENGFTGSLTNQGLLDVQRDLALNNSGATFDTSAGAVNVAPGTTLRWNVGNVVLGSGSTFSGSGVVAAGATDVNVTVNGNVTLPLGGPTFDFTGADVTIGGTGTLGNQGNGTLRVDNEQFGAGVQVINSGRFEVLTSLGSTVISGPFTNSASGLVVIDSTGGAASLRLDGTSSNAGEIELRGDGANRSELIATGAFDNAGFISAFDGTGISHQFAHNSFTNTGTVRTVDGDLSVLPVTFNHNAGALGADGGVLTVSGGSFNWNGGAVDEVDGGSVDLSGTAVAFGAGITIASPVTLNAPTFNGGTVRVVDGGTLTANGITRLDGGNIVMDAGALILDAVEVSAGSAFTLDGGSFEFTNVLTLNGGTATFGDVRVNVDGGSVVLAGGTLALAGSDERTVDFAINHAIGNAGSVLLNNAAGIVLDTAFNNAGNLTINGDTDVRGTGSIASTGALFKSGGGTSEVSVAVDSSGGLNVTSGVLQLTQTANLAGNVNGSTSSLLVLDAGAVVNNAAFNGGTVRVTGGSLTGNALTLASGGNLQFTSTAPTPFDLSSVVNNAGSSITLASGSAAIGAGGLSNAGQFAANTGAVSVAGGLSNSGAISAGAGGVSGGGGVSNSGSISTGGAVSAASGLTNSGSIGASGNVSAGSGLTNTGTISTNAGNITASSGLTNSGTLSAAAGGISSSLGVTNSGTATAGPGGLSAGGTVTNSGTISLVADGGVSSTALSNTGTLRKAGGSGISTVSAALANQGIVSVGSGTLAFPAGYTQSAGSTRVATGAILSAPDPVLVSGGTVRGGGTIASDVQNSGGTFSPGQSPGILSIDGDYVQGPGGTLRIELGGLQPGQYDVLDIDGEASLHGTLELSFLPGFPGAVDDVFDPLRYDSVQLLGGATGFSQISVPTGYEFEVFPSFADAAPPRLTYRLVLETTPFATRVPDATGQVVVVTQVGGSSPPPSTEGGSQETGGSTTESGSDSESGQSGESTAAGGDEGGDGEDDAEQQEGEAVAVQEGHEDEQPAGERKVLVCS